jgi:hypothetical protein
VFKTSFSRLKNYPTMQASANILKYSSIRIREDSSFITDHLPFKSRKLQCTDGMLEEEANSTKNGIGKCTRRKMLLFDYIQMYKY